MLCRTCCWLHDQLYAECAPLVPFSSGSCTGSLALVWRSLLGLAPSYLHNICCLTLSASVIALSALTTAFACTATMWNGAFSVVGLAQEGFQLVLSMFLRVHSDYFHAPLKTFSIMLGSGAFLSSSLEGVLYKSMNYFRIGVFHPFIMNEWMKNTNSESILAHNGWCLNDMLFSSSYKLYQTLHKF